jgi:type I restriction enzyme S subunit
MSELPSGWAQTIIGDLCVLINGRAFKPSDWTSSGLPIVRIQNLNRSDATFNFFDRAVDEKFLVETGDLLFAWSGTPGTSFGAHIWDGPKAILNQHIFNVRYNSQAVDKSFFRYAINQTLDEQIAKAHGGVGLRHVTKGMFEETVIALPPLLEQLRIVTKVDSLSAKSRRARDHLDHFPRLVEKYKLAILAAAFRGELTREWRKKNPERSGTSLLKELASNRLARRRSNMPTRNLVEPQLLPKEWTVARIEDICSEVVDGTHFTPEYLPEGVPFISVKDIRNGNIDFSDCKFISNEEHNELSKRCKPIAGDLLITKSGTIGRCAVVKENERAFSLFVSVALIRPATNNLRVKFLEHVLNYWISTIDTGSEITGSTIKNLHLQDIKALGAPVPPTSEQDEIVSQIAKAFSWIDRLAYDATSARKLIDHLDQAVLDRAFRGELVLQDPNDEPASLLLERIRAERGAASSLAKRGPAREGKRRSLAS